MIEAIGQLVQMNNVPDDVPLTEMLEPTGQIICRKEPYGAVCRWEGGKFARVHVETVREALGSVTRRHDWVGKVFEFGRLKMRVVSLMPGQNDSGWCDDCLVMLESPQAQLYWLYREHAEKLIRVVSNLEARLWCAWRGFMLRPMPEGGLLRFTGWLADRLL